MSAGNTVNHLVIPKGAMISFKVDGEMARQIAGGAVNNVNISYKTTKKQDFAYNHLYETIPETPVYEDEDDGKQQIEVPGYKQTFDSDEPEWPWPEGKETSSDDPLLKTITNL